MRYQYKPALGSFILFYLLSFSSFAQDTFNNYKPLQSSGQIPVDFLQLSSEKYTQEKNAISKSDKAFDKRAKKDFFLESSFLIRDLLYSGRVLFNDPVSVYINQVADQLLAGNPALRGKIRFYVVKSPSVNAFATNSGMIFINLGLISQTETESQLAFILSHEITHYLKKHVVSQYVEDKKIEKGKKLYRSLSSEDKLLSRTNYSKELETEADLEGLSIFLQSNYSTRQLNGVFDMLQYAYLPFDDIPFKKSFFESEHLQFPATCFLDKVKAIAPPTDKDETESTHPSVEKRRAYILSKIGKGADTIKSDYLVSKAAFLQARKIARFELSHLYLTSLRYEKAIYNSYLLLQEDPNNLYLQKNIAKALYGLTKYANEEAFNSVHEDEERIEGHSQQVYHLFERLKGKELNALALKYSLDLKRKFPTDVALAQLSDDLLKALVVKHCKSEDDFSAKPLSEVRQGLIEASLVDTTEAAQRNKYQKIAIDQLKTQTEETEYFIKYAFVEDFKDEAFAKNFDKYLQEKQLSTQERNETKKQKRSRLRAENKQKARQERIISKKGAALGIDKVVMINPAYSKIDQRKAKSIRYLDSESAELKLNEQIQKNAQLAKLKVDIISDNTLQSSDVNKFNDYAFLRTWIREHINHLDASVTMGNLDVTSVQELVAKYGTKYYCWTGFASVREKKRMKAAVFFGSLVFAPTIPYALYYVTMPEYDTYYYSIVFDLTTGKPVFQDIQFIDKRNSRDVINSTVYNTFYQLKNKR
ncbi:MAG: M48 family metallopeptidase [Bacteroidota bacterium]